MDFPDTSDSSDNQESDASSSIDGSVPDERPQQCLELQDDDDNDEGSPTTSASKPSNSMHVSVQRAEISSTVVQEGNNELDQLDVEVYDQQTYEEGVFEQVNKAISEAEREIQKGQDVNNSSRQSSKISDLMQLIHSQNDEVHDNEKEPTDSTARDEHVLQLTRQQRLNKNIKIEKPDCDQPSESIKRLPKIPKLSSTSSKISKVTNIDASKQVVQTNEQSRFEKPVIYQPLRVKQEPMYDEENSDSNESSISEYKPSAEDETAAAATDDEFDEDIDYETDSEPDKPGDDEEQKSSRRRKRLEDDGDFKSYQARIKAFSKARAKLRLENILDDGTEFKKLDELVQIEGNLHVPKDVWDNLFEHQKTGVRWLWELHQLGTGGILGDEMGLGKTIQMIAFLVALRSSTLANAHKGYENLGPVVLVCPATVMHQWLIEFRKWWPPFRVAILHSTGTFSGDRKNLVQVINKFNGILIVSYPGVVIYQDYLHNFDWHYTILDEGHKIRNPDAQVTLACKRFRTPHRLILSGSPVQNNLKELWSIFDFIYPGKLGTLPVFMEQFATPITQGGYANASDIQVQIAYKCTCVLRDTIKPFLLRRTKAEVNNKLKLPERSEQVLFCKLTDKQRKLYQAYLDSPTVRDIRNGYCQIFVGLIQLRKICNHPDLFDSTDCRGQIKAVQEVQKTNKQQKEFFSVDETYGHFKKSGKMMVVEALLKLWKEQNHKVLLFTQSRQMLKIFKIYMNERNYSYLIMDGSTPIGIRQTMIEEFNTNQDIFIFLLTTRVGGVGVNLIGANRIVIYDPDWNPSTDIQARERAWRIGQQRHVIIYRLLTAGTIEEKIYHRQVFKLYLTNRVLKDAKQKRFFKTNDLHELFTLGDNEKNIETKALFDDDLQINLESIKRSKSKSKKRKKRKREKEKEQAEEDQNTTQALSEEKLQAMRERAKRLSQMIASQYGSQSNNQESTIRVKIEPGTCPPETITEQAVIVKKEPSLIPDRANLHRSKPSESIVDQQEKKSEKRSKKESRKQHVEYLVKQDIYKPDVSESKSDPRYKRDDYILERLFKNSNIFGALKHDKIETDSNSDYKVVESEAEKVARDAIRALRESRRMCLDSSSGVPNWTGRNGQIASTPRLMPKNKGRTPLLAGPKPSSSNGDSLLSSIKKRNQTNPIALAKSLFGHASQDSDDEERDKDFKGKAEETGAEGMADKIREYVLFRSARSGEAQTDELLEFFKANFKPDKTAVFKALLYKMCDFSRRGDKGFWLIKSEFKDI